MLFNGSLVTTDPLRQIIRDHYRADEDQVLDYLLPLAEVDAKTRSRAWERARQLVLYIRQSQVGKGGVDALLNEFSLSTEEGLVLMCLAEALLRVPDPETIDALIADKIEPSNWGAHLGQSASPLVNAATWGLMLTGRILDDEPGRPVAALLFTPLAAIAGLGGPALQQIMSNIARDDQQGELQGVLSSVAAIAMGISPLIMTAIFAFFTRESTPIYAPGMPFVAAAAMMVLALAILWAYRPRGAVVPPAEATGRPPGAA